MERLTQEQFDRVINLLILYKQIQPQKDVYLNETSFKEATQFFSKSISKDIIEQNKELLKGLV
jgi:hypothetical protein